MESALQIGFFWFFFIELATRTGIASVALGI